MGGVGALVILSVPLKDTPRVFSIKSCGTGRQTHEYARQTGRDPVHHIVQLGRRPAKVAIPVILVPYHRIHGIDGLVEHSQGRPPQGQAQKRRDHAVRGVLCHGLHRRFGDAGPVQPVCIPSHDHGDRPPGLFQGPVPQGQVDLYALVLQGSGSQKLITQCRLCGKRQPGMDTSAQP